MACVFLAVVFNILLTLSGARAQDGQPWSMANGDSINNNAGEYMTAKDEGQKQVTVTGTFAARGDGVECPKIKTKNGALVGVSYISPEIPIGTQISVTGFYAILTTCRGRVVVAQETKMLE